MFAIVDLETETVIRRLASLARVMFPNGDIVDNPPVGYESPPRYADTDPPARWRLYAIRFVDTGTGPVIVETGPPVFDARADEVTLPRSRAERPPARRPLDEVMAELLVEKGQITQAEIDARRGGAPRPAPPAGARP